MLLIREIRGHQQRTETEGHVQLPGRFHTINVASQYIVSYNMIWNTQCLRVIEIQNFEKKKKYYSCSGLTSATVQGFGIFPFPSNRDSHSPAKTEAMYTIPIMPPV